MIHLRIVCEGQTEERFVHRLLREHLHRFDVKPTALLVRDDWRRRPQGGGMFGNWRDKLERLLRSHKEGQRFTTLIDLYGLPADFPHRSHVFEAGLSGHEKCLRAEAELRRAFPDPRFIPYVQSYEFEALVLASIHQLENVMTSNHALRIAEKLHDQIAGLEPEEINDGPETPPSKRLQRIPGYRKTIHGIEAVELTGLRHLRASCPRFAAWLTELEGLAGMG